MHTHVSAARAALDGITADYVAHEAALAAAAQRVAEAEAQALEAQGSVAECTARLATDAASRRALLSAASEARAGMETELWCIAAALEEKQRCVT